MTPTVCATCRHRPVPPDRSVCEACFPPARGADVHAACGRQRAEHIPADAKPGDAKPGDPVRCPVLTTGPDFDEPDECPACRGTGRQDCGGVAIECPECGGA